MFRYYAIDSFSPTNYNWGHWSNQEFTDLVRKAQATFNADEQTKLLQQAHAIVVDEAPWLFIVHDLNPRAMNKKVTGFKPAQSWSQDFTPDHHGVAEGSDDLPPQPADRRGGCRCRRRRCRPMRRARRCCASP